MFEVMKRYLPDEPGPAFTVRLGRPNASRSSSRARSSCVSEKGVSYYREPSAEAAWRHSRPYGPTRSLAASLDVDRRARFREDFIAFHAGFPTDLASACRATG